MRRRIIAILFGICMALTFGVVVYAEDGQNVDASAEIVLEEEIVQDGEISQEEDISQDEPSQEDDTSQEEEPPAEETPITGLQDIDGKLYWYHADGQKAAKGWIDCEDGNRRYAMKGGVLATGYKKIGKRYYYFKKTDGTMRTGLVTIKKKPYWFNENGKAAAKGWIKLSGGEKKYSAGKGKLKTGWISIGDYGYYFDKKTGSMARNTKVNGIKINAKGRTHTAYGKAIKVLNKNGWNLRAGFNYAIMPYREMVEDPGLGSAWYGNYGITNRRGNCYVQAGTFYVMAKLLGYDVHQVSGYVGSAPHSWCEIVHNGKIYVYDPNFQASYGRNGFKIRYGQPGTWRYNSWHRMN